jgi:hypothetical protein
MATLTYYMDETGNRQPDKRSDASRAGRDWFGLGGYIVSSDDEAAVKQSYEDFCARWDVRSPLHLTDMMAEKKNFAWIGRLSQRERDTFWSEYKSFLSGLPVVGSACIIDRPGYVARGYLEKHPNTKWLLCRSAFDITVERAVKYATARGMKLNIVFESDVAINDTVKGYFTNLKANGLEFDGTNSAKYQPLATEHFSDTLLDAKWKTKSSRMLQIADSYIYAIARGRYDKKFDMYRELRDARKIMNFALDSAEDITAMGVKYYCF